jgi:hypothetical protein
MLCAPANQNSAPLPDATPTTSPATTAAVMANDCNSGRVWLSLEGGAADGAILSACGKSHRPAIPPVPDGTRPTWGRLLGGRVHRSHRRAIGQEMTIVLDPSPANAPPAADSGHSCAGRNGYVQGRDERPTRPARVLRRCCRGTPARRRTEEAGRGRLSKGLRPGRCPVRGRVGPAASANRGTTKA